MTRDRVIVAMLGAVAVLLALNLVRGETKAQAQNGPPFLDSAEPTVVSVTMGRDLGTVADDYRIIRAWSDGTVDMTFVGFEVVPAGGTACEILSTCGPVSIIPPP